MKFRKFGLWPRRISGNFFQYLEKASESWPVFGKKYFFMGKYSWNLPGNSFRKIPWVTSQNCKIWKKSGKSFRDIPWLTARFLEIVSGICLYGLIAHQQFSKNHLTCSTNSNKQNVLRRNIFIFDQTGKTVWYFFEGFGVFK